MLRALKVATSARHAALEQRLPLLDVHLSQATYLHYVRRLFGFYEPLEAQLLGLSGWAAVGVDYALRCKTPRLLQDLQVLGESPAVIAALPRCRALPSLGSPAELWGCLYVIEGATLGGQIIIRHLTAHLGLDERSGASFFDGYGRQTGAQWKAFCAAVPGAADQSPGEQQAMLDSANQTFDRFSEWLFPGSTMAAPVQDWPGHPPTA